MNIEVKYNKNMKEAYNAIEKENLFEADDIFYSADPSVEETKRLELLQQVVNLNPFHGDAKMELVRIKYSGKVLSEELSKLVKFEAKFLKDVKNITPEHSSGHYWGIIETRPYMRMNYNLAEVYFEIGEVNKGIKILEMLFEVSKFDNMGIRFIFPKHLLAHGKYNKLRIFLGTTYYNWCMDQDLEYTFTNEQAYCMLAVSARYNNPRNFMQCLEIIDEEIQEFIVSDQQLKNSSINEFVRFVEETNEEYNNLSMIRDYYYHVKANNV